MRLAAFWTAMLMAVAILAIILYGKSVYAAVTLAWMAGVMLGFSLFSDGDE